MFEHKGLDGKWNRVIPAIEGFTKGELLECRDAVGKDPVTTSRRQYGVIGEQLVERCLPPESIGDHWSYDVKATPWWGSVINPPHAGLVADFNSHIGGLYRKPLDLANNVVAFASEGEPVLFSNNTYKVVRQSDSKELTATSILELRKLYFA